MNISEDGNDSGAAGVMAGACKQDIDEVHVCFLNCYEKNLVNIKSFYATPKGEGFGTKAMQFICDIADEKGIHLVLKPTYGNERERVRDFYERFGFKTLNPAELIRYSKNYHIENAIIESRPNKGFFSKIMKFFGLYNK